MTQSTLRQVLTIFETAVTPLSLPNIARELNVSQERLEVMIQHWVRKGKIRESSTLTECGTCGHSGGCPFVLDLPRTYELVANDKMIPLSTVDIACPQAPSKNRIIT